MENNASSVVIIFLSCMLQKHLKNLNMLEIKCYNKNLQTLIYIMY